MKMSSLVLVGTLASNVVLIAIFVAGAVDKSASTSASDESHLPPLAVVARDPAAMAANLWAEIHSDDLPSQRDKLRADAFPPAMIRAILVAQIRAGFAARRKALEAAQADLPFWRNASPDPNTQAAFRALSKEEQKAIKDLIGSDPENGPAAALRRQFPNFSDETIDQLAAIRERYDQQRMDLFTNIRGPGGMLPDEQAKYDALDKAMHGEFAAVLTPQDLEDYDLRTSNSANQLRYNLVAFNATEQEFRALYKLQSAFDEEFRMLRGTPSEDQMRRRSEGQKQLNDQIKAALGTDRYAEYQRATDYNFRQTTQLVARLELPPETANSLYAVQKEFEQRRNDIYRSSSGGGAAPGSERLVEQATALQQEALARVTPILGSASYVEAYKQYGGSWLANMVPRSPPRAVRPKL